MSTEEHKTITRRFVEEPWNNGNFAIFDEVLAPDYVLHPDGNRQVLERAITQFRTAFPDLHLTIEEMIAEGDKVAYRWTARGTHQQEFGGIAPTGKQIHASGITMLRFANGKIVEDRFESGGPSIQEQLTA